MIQEFLNYIDEATEFGKLRFTGDQLFKMFAERKNLGPKQALGLRWKLEAKGIL